MISNDHRFILTIIICAFKVNFLTTMINGLFPGRKLESPRDMTNGLCNICPVVHSLFHIRFNSVLAKNNFSLSVWTVTSFLMVSHLSNHRLATTVSVIHVFFSFSLITVSFTTYFSDMEHFDKSVKLFLYFKSIICITLK